MKRVYILLLITCLGGINVLSSQFSAQSSVTRQGFELLPQEGIFIHQNNKMLFAGERLYYKIYCLDLESSRLSNLSKIAYVELIDEDKSLVFRQKVRLDKGTGNGDFSIPAEVTTGSYKLIGYTSWMQNRAERPFFETDLIIINPYKVTPKPHQVERQLDTISSDSIPVIEAPIVHAKPVEVSLGEDILKMSLGESTTGTRSEVTLEIGVLNTEALNGSYSFSVRKIDEDFPQIASAPVDVWKGFSIASSSGATGTIYLPELRGELIIGKVVNKSSGEAMAGRQVVFSLPGDQYILDIAQTDQSGTFYFNINSEVATADAVLQVLGDDKDEFDILIDEQSTPDTGELDFPDFTLDKSLETKILERSIHNQIENSYASVKSDTISRPEEQLPFYRNYQQRFFLDDYTRFNTLRETMVEIIDNAWIDENDGDPIFGVRPMEGYLDVGGLKPMVFVDGLFIQDHKDVVDYNSKEIRRISISRDRYMVGPKVYQGLLAIETKAGDFHDVFYRGFLVNNTISRPKARRSYFFQEHGNAGKTARIPDFRYQLYWEPYLKIEQEQQNITFYTSDISGEFELELKGYTARGRAVSLRQRLKVK